MRWENRQKPNVRQPKSAEGGEQSFAFRRSRTITGSAATSVRAASEDHGQLRSPRLHEHSLRKHRRKLLSYLAVCLVVSGVLFYVIMDYIGTVSAVATRSTQPVSTSLDEDRYRGLVDRYLSEHPSERFGFSLNDTQFNQFMVEQAPEVSGAQLQSDDTIGGASLIVQLREPVVAWTIKNKQYFVDAEGVAYTTNYFAKPGVIVTDKSGVSTQAGVIASNKLLRFIGRVITLVNQSQAATVESVLLPANSTREIDFKMRGDAYIIKANLDRDPAGQAADVINAIRYVQLKGITPAYLDVRVSSKAYYR